MMSVGLKRMMLLATVAATIPVKVEDSDADCCAAYEDEDIVVPQGCRKVGKRLVTFGMTAHQQAMAEKIMARFNTHVRVKSDD